MKLTPYIAALLTVLSTAFSAAASRSPEQPTRLTLEQAEAEALTGAVHHTVRIGEGETARDITVSATPMRSVYRGKYHKVTEEGDTVLVVIFNDITVFPQMKFRNKKEQDFYWRTVRDVKKALPYAKLICETLLETYEYIETFPTQQERELYLKQMESQVFEQYKPALKKFTKGQAKLLVKLIQRETNQSSYDILKAFLGSFRATFWQGFGRLFGVNLKGTYNPASNRNDAIIERVCVAVEQGQV